MSFSGEKKSHSEAEVISSGQLCLQYIQPTITTPTECMCIYRGALVRRVGGWSSSVLYLGAACCFSHSVTSLPGHEGLQHSHTLFGEVILSNNVLQGLQVARHHQHRLHLVLTLTGWRAGGGMKQGCMKEEGRWTISKECWKGQKWTEKCRGETMEWHQSNKKGEEEGDEWR